MEMHRKRIEAWKVTQSSPARIRVLNSLKGNKGDNNRNESNVKIEFSKELVTELQNNTFSGRCEEDAIRHISKVLKILDLVKIARVDTFQLRMKAFPLSLSKGEKEWRMNEGNGNISTWEELVKKFFKKFYPLSCTSNYDKMYDDDEEGRDPLEFIPWRNSKFKDPKKVDETTKRALLYTWTEMNKYCPPARTAKKMEAINNFQHEPDESLFRAWENF
ncbi:hypothetical protein Tco_0670577 [Tanacetum coccineum]